ncbi:MAG: hypothetical protein A2W91_11835 [Bacteroidetes bacterium GWF2_38_335]|nr:MAG: hypothetical protein A2W91_11835 [Bacteroidetes bacterium GWF2_38_335]OFY77968.1 MAG: hypothetical protein A2281_18580 [Bacteroidetes bacterium RIFOXYA12_FULL_38_20]HBS86711.1 hypothetical protein [Bacteroidales bacterium]
MVFFRNTIISVFLLCAFNGLVAQPRVTPQQPDENKKAFEGSIKCVQQTMIDTLYYTYHVKGQKVRVDEHGKNNEVENSLLFDLDEKTIHAISPKRKLFMSIAVKPYVESDNDEYEIIKSKNNKVINGYNCYQWRVKNKKLNTEIAYWVAYDNFSFFEDFLKLWNRTENSAIFFLKIPDVMGFFPMLQVERTLLREERTRQSVVDVEKKQLNDNLFEIPKDFKSFDR